MKSINSRKKGLKISILILVLFFVSFSFVLAAGSLWFGGRITSTMQCNCSGGSQVTISGLGAKYSGTYLYLPGATQIRGKGNVLSGRFIIGKYSPGGECMMGTQPYCIVLPISKGTMNLIGTN